jgi:exodeoxyribonuclease V alpha subunit
MTALDPFDVRRVSGAAGLLREFNEAGVLTAADVHVAQRLASLVGESDEAVMLAAALAIRAPRLGHVHVDLATIRDTATVDTDEPVDLATLPWPAGWVERVAATDLVGVGEDDADPTRPLRLVDTRLYLDRYWRDERRVAADLLSLGASRALGVRDDVLADGIDRLFAGDTGGREALAAASAVRRRFAVVAGGPGTGKTTTVARIVALLAEQAAVPPLVALAAPTGKAAARLEEAVHAEALTLPVDPAVRDHLLGLHASTLHRLLGRRPGSHSRFRHSRAQHLPHDVVIVDETSMVSLSLMARLVEAIRPGARLILVGDPAQLASIEAGAVLGDIVGVRPLDSPALKGSDPPFGIVVLDRVHRFGGGIARLAEAIRRGDADGVLGVLGEAPEGVTWIPSEPADSALAPVRDRAVAAGRAVRDAARAGAPRDAIEALGAFRLLCAHRRGPDGVATWNTQIEGWLGVGGDGP